MLSTHGEEVLGFIRDFETSSREYLRSKGLTDHEMNNAFLDLQWDFLHAILNHPMKKAPRAHQPYILHRQKHAI